MKLPFYMVIVKDVSNGVFCVEVRKVSGVFGSASDPFHVQTGIGLGGSLIEAAKDARNVMLDPEFMN